MGDRLTMLPKLRVPVSGLRLFGLGALCLALAGCSLPRSAPLQSEVMRSAPESTAEFAVYEVTRGLLPVLATWPGLPDPRPAVWPRRGGGDFGTAIAPGDEVRITIWDTEDNSLFTAPGESRSAFEPMTVSPGGTIFLPYIGQVRIAGSDVTVARQTVERLVQETVPSAQVQLEVVSGRNNAIDMVSGVNRPGRFPLSDRNVTVLSAIALGGGVAPSVVNPQVRLQRGSHTYGSSLAAIAADPHRNALVRGGDLILIESDPRSFQALGAVGEAQLVPFDRDVITAREAMSMVGGLMPERANPQGILIFREYPRAATPGHPGPTQPRVVFSFDLTTPDGVFSADRFTVADGDLVMVTESPVTAAQTILRLFANAVGIRNAL
jgi:polysaccharide export outer membrane protein